MNSPEMRYRCALVDFLPEEDRTKLQMGIAWDEVTSLPYRLQIPTRFCRHSTRPGPDWLGQKCEWEIGMMCIKINEPPFGDMLGFESFPIAVLSVLFPSPCLLLLRSCN